LRERLQKDGHHKNKSLSGTSFGGYDQVCAISYVWNGQSLEWFGENRNSSFPSKCELGNVVIITGNCGLGNLLHSIVGFGKINVRRSWQIWQSFRLLGAIDDCSKS
jgi:hypothetical protein